jgi:hypothetical protein
MMARTKLLLLPLLGLAACAPSPLYTGGNSYSNAAEIPRDARGEPLWSAIRQGQPQPIARPYPTGQGIPILPPPGAVPILPPPQ